MWLATLRTEKNKRERTKMCTKENEIENRYKKWKGKRSYDFQERKIEKIKRRQN